jgi:anionic cell wall polymer biosynthesis LytR-Cps2A-Psr (LCP) family protein
MATYERKKGETTGWIIVGVIVLMIAGVVFAGRFFRSEEKLKSAFTNGRMISFVISGVNAQKKIKGCFAFFFNPKTNRVSIVSILPQTYIRFGKSNYLTIEDALIKKTGNDVFKDAISNLLGMPIDYYAFIDKDNFMKLIDMIGGVEIYSDGIKNVDTNTNIPSGLTLLDGDKSIEYLSFSLPERLESRYEQLARNEKFIRGFLRLKDDFAEAFNEKIMLDYLYRLVNTDMSVNDMKIFYSEIRKRFENKISDFSKGSEGIILYCDRKENVPGYKFIYIPKKSGEWVKGELKESIGNIRKEFLPDNTTKIVVEIQNGTDIVGLGVRTKDYLSTYGFDILEVGNADNSKMQNTVVIVRNSEQKASKLAELIKCKRITKGDPYPDKKIDVTLVLGRDFDGKEVK